MGFKSIKIQLQVLPFQYIFKTDKVQHEAQECVGTAAGGIAKSLQIHQLAKRRIKKINQGYNKIAGGMEVSAHESQRK